MPDVDTIVRAVWTVAMIVLVTWTFRLMWNTRRTQKDTARIQADTARVRAETALIREQTRERQAEVARLRRIVEYMESARADSSTNGDPS